MAFVETNGGVFWRLWGRVRRGGEGVAAVGDGYLGYRQGC